MCKLSRTPKCEISAIGNIATIFAILNAKSMYILLIKSSLNKSFFTNFNVHIISIIIKVIGTATARILINISLDCNKFKYVDAFENVPIPSIA